jgi:soluble lytic murein transglycosylase-like protein
VEDRNRWEDREARIGRESLVALVRKPVVQLLLVAAAAAQVVDVSSGLHAARAEGETVATAAGSAESLVRLDPVRVDAESAADPAVRQAWMRQAVRREADRIAAEYRRSGYNVTPQLAGQIAEAAAEYDIAVDVAFGLVRAESSFRNAATSPVGAVGLTQLMPRTAAWMEPGITRAQLRDPETNLRVGFKYLRYLLDKYEGDENLALLAYNRGPGTVDNAIKRGRNPDNGYADFVRGKENHGHRLFTR